MQLFFVGWWVSCAICVPGYAAFEDVGSGAVSAAMGESISAAPAGIGSIDYNPAGMGEAQTPEVQAGFKTAGQIPAGTTDYSQMSGAAGMPLGPHDALGVSWLYMNRNNVFLDRSIGLTYATKKWKETENGFLDFGITAKGLFRAARQSGGSATTGAVDVGALYRLGDNQVFGVSVFNINQPKIRAGGTTDLAPLIGKIGYSQVIRGFSMSVDATKREASAGFRASQSLAAGLQYWWNTATAGSLAGRTGLNLSDRSKYLGVGFGWRVLGGEANYALMVPLASGTRYGNAISLLFRFGEYNPEREYEKVLGTEIHMRQELTRILDRSEDKQKQLAAELDQLHLEIASLRTALTNKTAEEAAVRERLKVFEERERKARESMEKIEAERRAAALRSKESLYREDWTNFQKLKNEGAPDVVLIERLKQILRQYKDAGVDLSLANQELLRLLRNRPAP